MTDETTWEIAGSGGEPILGVAHAPAEVAPGPPAATVIVAHGFKGFMDYGMFPAIARTLASAGLHAHRFNFSHSGVTRDPRTFARPELFERDTWNRQVEDLAAIHAALDAGRLPGGDRPRVWLGHSRGGASVILAAGRGALGEPAGIATAAAPADAVRLDEADRARLRREGFLPSPSARTGQALRVGRAWLEEIEADPHDHDPCVQAGRIRCPMLIVHGADDATVPVSDAERLARAAGGPVETLVIPAGDHVFGTPHPASADAPPSPALEALLGAVIRFARSVVGEGS